MPAPLPAMLCTDCLLLKVVLQMFRPVQGHICHDLPLGAAAHVDDATFTRTSYLRILHTHAPMFCCAVKRALERPYSIGVNLLTQKAEAESSQAGSGPMCFTTFKVIKD